MTLVILAAIALVLFILAFLTKRRFGVLGLGLAAGAVLSQAWGRELGFAMAANQIPVGPLSYTTAATVALILIPALLLLIAGPKYAKRGYAVIGAVLFALLGTLLLIAPLLMDLPTTDATIESVLDFVAKWQNVLIAGGIALAIVDTLHAQGAKFPGKKHSKH